MRKWMIGLTMAALVVLFSGKAMAEDAAPAADASAPADISAPAASDHASEQGKAHAHHGKKKGHHKEHHKKHKKS